MPTKILRKNLKKTALIVNCFLFIFTSYVLAADKVVPEKQGELSSHSQQAKLYRDEGFKFQETGDLDSALKLYQKAVELDPEYAVVHNDLGVIYEAQGSLERAEESYLQAIKLDPSYVSAYSNLALLYEEQRDLTKAAYFWRKRIELGNPDDLWTLKAQQRLEDISLILSGRRVTNIQEEDINDLTQDTISRKSTSGQSSKQATAKKTQNTGLNSFERSYSAEMQQALEDARR